ncbi:hypothetical protein [Hasllibacter sp. MH4015]|uniref:hypothetical protein n=1 Tax=Hasllibacter sp. MH4015 TaxID=2854029 RepID=UPI001CD6BDEA|nr:hypothetical protein [Hasllibacter sp. MH4015]
MTGTAIEFVDVLKRCGEARAVDRINVSIKKGELVTFLGCSGWRHACRLSYWAASNSGSP